MKTLDEIYAAALAVDQVSYRVGNEKFERFVQCATPVAVTGMIDEIRSLRQKLEAAESALREAREQKPVKGVYWREGAGVFTSNPMESDLPLYLRPVPAMPVQDDKPMPIETAPLEGEFLAERSNGEWLIVHNQKDVFKTGNRIVCHGESGRFWAAKRWMPLVKSEVKPS